MAIGPVALLRRWIRRHQRLRRSVGTVVAKVSSVRARTLTVRQRWDRAISYESTFWEDWLATKSFEDVEEYEKRLDPESPLEEELITDLFGHLPDETILILDVGAGPLTTLGKTYPGKKVDITAVDALAAEYDRILSGAGVTPPVRTQLCHGERLLETFTPSSFHIAYAANALDHSYDPILVIRNMLAVVKTAGFVVLSHRRNEAESKRYLGLHQWNFDHRGGRFLIWNRAQEHDMTTLLEDEADVQCRERDSYVECVITKRLAAVRPEPT